MTSADFIFFFLEDLNEGLLETNGKMSGCFTLRREKPTEKKTENRKRIVHTVSFSSFSRSAQNLRNKFSFNTKVKKGREREREREREMTTKVTYRSLQARIKTADQPMEDHGTLKQFQFTLTNILKLKRT